MVFNMRRERFGLSVPKNATPAKLVAVFDLSWWTPVTPNMRQRASKSSSREELMIRKAITPTRQSHIVV